MKSMILVLLLALLATSYGYNNMKHANGKELLHILEGGYYQDGGLHRVYVILFYNPGVGSENLQAKNDEYRAAVRTHILDRWPNIYYTEVDATHSDYKHFTQDIIGVDTEELVHSPSILIMEYGQGIWIHGPEAVGRIASYVPAYEERGKHVVSERMQYAPTAPRTVRVRP